ncbi:MULTISPECIES: hypothetical protein [unclassified Roseivivax]|uniref:hypothetical protein n=1 Tax=unclassified Roseivivax TaxID=2639302 RepID=UPI0012684271|nr:MULTISPECIES: hypothetical protein [unclassified Roseivivax]
MARSALELRAEKMIGNYNVGRLINKTRKVAFQKRLAASAIRDHGVSPEAYIRRILAEVCVQELSSGQHHFYRSKLNREGHSILRLLFLLLSEMRADGEIDDVALNQMKSDLLKEIKEVG